MNKPINNEKSNSQKQRKPLPKAKSLLNNIGWQVRGGAGGSHDCSAGCQQTMINKTCRCV